MYLRVADRRQKPKSELPDWARKFAEQHSTRFKVVNAAPEPSTPEPTPQDPTSQVPTSQDPASQSLAPDSLVRSEDSDDGRTTDFDVPRAVLLPGEVSREESPPPGHPRIRIVDAEDAEEEA